MKFLGKKKKDPVIRFLQDLQAVLILESNPLAVVACNVHRDFGEHQICSAGKSLHSNLTFTNPSCFNNHGKSLALHQSNSFSGDWPGPSHSCFLTMLPASCHPHLESKELTFLDPI